MITQSQFHSRRDKRRARYRAHMHHLAWGVVCLFLLVSLGAILVRAQSLELQNASLQQQLQAIRTTPTDTCHVASSWKPNSTTVLSALGRNYRVHLPAAFDSSTYYPLVMFYAGKGGTAEGIEYTFGTDSLPVIAVYPQSTPSTDGSLAWESAPYSSRADDVAFTTTILDQLQVKLCVDKTRIYAAGFSNGGGFASLLSCKLSERIAAIAIVSGAMYAPASDCKPPRPVPLINIHGDNDGIVPYGGSLTRRLPNIDTWTHDRAVLNGCKNSFTDTARPGQIVTTWSDCMSNATVESVRVIGGGHGWNLISNLDIWQFLSRFTLS